MGLSNQLESTEIDELIGDYKGWDPDGSDDLGLPDEGDYEQWDLDVPEETAWSPKDKKRLESELAKQRKAIQQKDRDIGKLLPQPSDSRQPNYGTTSKKAFEHELAKQRQAIEQKRREIGQLCGHSGNPWSNAVFSTKEKGRHVNVNADRRSAQNNHTGTYSTVRAGVYVPRDGAAFATIKVNRTGEVGIGVLTEGYTGWDDSKNVNNNEALSYDCEKDTWHENPYESTGLPTFPAGMEIFVALTGGVVSFSIDSEEVHRFPLPKNCGPVTLGITLKRAKVTFI